MITQQLIIDNVNDNLKVIKANSGQYKNAGWWKIKYVQGKWYQKVDLIYPESLAHPTEKELSYGQMIFALIDNEIKTLYADKIDKKIHREIEVQELNRKYKKCVEDYLKAVMSDSDDVVIDKFISPVTLKFSEEIVDKISGLIIKESVKAPQEINISSWGKLDFTWESDIGTGKYLSIVIDENPYTIESFFQGDMVKEEINKGELTDRIKNILIEHFSDK